jgi:Tfp pilus assembly protein PilZ
MIDIRENKGLNFIIGQWRPITENFKGGGHLCMHMLAYKLAERGHNVYICCEPYFKHNNITQLECNHHIDNNGNDVFTIPNIIYNHSNTISVYTQVTWGNPFNTNNVVRWFMYDTDIPIEETFSENDVYFNFTNCKVKYKEREVGQLVLFNFNEDKLWNYNKDRSGYCHIIHKHTPKNYKEILSKYNSFDLTDWREKGGWDYLREQLNKFEYYLTFDDVSYFTNAAVMCGCKSIVIPTEKSKIKYINPTDFRHQNRYQGVGVSYGFDDLEWANKTKDFIIKHIEDIKIINDKMVDDFVDYWSKKLK